jgi:hypothetical protein
VAAQPVETQTLGHIGDHSNIHSSEQLGFDDDRFGTLAITDSGRCLNLMGGFWRTHQPLFVVTFRTSSSPRLCGEGAWGVSAAEPKV